ncbi:MAG: Acyl-CoA thioester hydrolase [Promethearchaeota archaeon]|nr:MAG: Acyl-CoA thioester hydrolase [Candidatus Lokiarchaeota archaeon]
MSEELKKYPVIIELPILWGYMDSFQHVNNIFFFRFFESARIAYFEKIGFLETMEKTAIGPILASTKCKYISPLKYSNTIQVGAKIDKMEKYGFIMKYIIINKSQHAIAAIGEAKIVSYDYNKKEKSYLPDSVQKKIFELEPHLT